METTTYKLKDILKIGNGKDHSNLKDGDYPVLGSGGVMRYVENYLYDGESVLLPRKGTLNNIQYIKGKFWTVDTCYYTIINKNIVNPYFLYRLLNSYDLSGLDSGASIPSMTSKCYYGIKVQLPPLPTQQKIAGILSKYDEAIENNSRRIKLLEQMAQNLYKEWFVRFRFPGWQTSEFENGVPKGWKVEKLGNLANISTGKCNREDAEENGIYPLFDRSQETKLSNDWIKDCEAIIVPGEGTAFIPRYYVGKFNLHQRCYCVEPKFEKTGKFLFYTLMINRSYFLSVATGATVPSLRYGNFASMKFIMPKIDICQRYDDFVTKCFNQIDNLRQQTQNLSRQRDLLLPRLMSGKLQVLADTPSAL